jgi:hypothetical protein
VSDNKSKSNKKIFEIDISRFEELQDLLYEYFGIFAAILNKEDISIQKIIINHDSEKVIVEGLDLDEDSEEDTEPDFTWI